MYSQLLLPRMKLYTGWSPNRVRKYQDKLDTHLTSKSRVPTPDWSIDLNCGVSGKGSFTASEHRLANACNGFVREGCDGKPWFLAHYRNANVPPPCGLDTCEVLEGLAVIWVCCEPRRAS